MIRRPSGDGWQLVRQPDHAELACALLDAIAAAPRGPREGFRLAVAHHDDGWAERDAEPRPGPDGPETFLQLDLAEHLALAAASVRIAAGLDPYAEAIVALHCAWLHGARAPSEAAAWRARAERRAADLGVAPADLDHDQRLCAMVDYLSLWLCGWPDGDELPFERPDGTTSRATRDADAIRLPADLLPTACDLSFPTLIVDSDTNSLRTSCRMRREHLKVFPSGQRSDASTDQMSRRSRNFSAASRP